MSFLDSSLRKLPDDWRVHAARGLTLAGLGRRDEALRQASWLQQSEVCRDDAMQGPYLAENRPQILAQAGKASAVARLVESLSLGINFLL